MAGKFYGVHKGKEGNKIYTTWAEAEANVKGIKGVTYKSFPTLKEAEDFINGGGVYKKLDTLKESNNVIKKDTNKEIEQETEKEYVRENTEDNNSNEYKAYVDGSFKEGRKCYGYGLVILKGDTLIYSEKGAEALEEYVTMRNVAGEVKGAMKAMDYALNNKIDLLHIYYDYMGVECWAKGTWKRNNVLTRSYYNYYNGEIKNRVQIQFHKVRGHSGDKFNDLADKLAKEAVDEF